MQSGNEKRRRVAANEVVIGDRRLKQCVVEISSGMVTDYYTFEEEQPYTEWLGGTIILVRDKENSLRAFKNGNLIQ